MTIFQKLAEESKESWRKIRLEEDSFNDEVKKLMGIDPSDVYRQTQFTQIEGWWVQNYEPKYPEIITDNWVVIKLGVPGKTKSLRGLSQEEREEFLEILRNVVEVEI